MDSESRDLKAYWMTDAAYVVMTLHASKYYGAVTGLLLGKIEEGCVKIDETVPIAHSDLTIWTTPLTQMALYVTEKHAKESNKQVIGLYFANDVPTDQSVPTPPTRIADRIREYFAHAVLLHLDAARLTPEKRESSHCCRVCVKSQKTGTWSRAIKPDTTLNVSSRALAIVHEILTAYFDDTPSIPYDINLRKVADFEDHCLDPRCDWLNDHITKKINSMTH